MAVLFGCLYLDSVVATNDPSQVDNPRVQSTIKQQHSRYQFLAINDIAISLNERTGKDKQAHRCDSSLEPQRETTRKTNPYPPPERDREDAIDCLSQRSVRTDSIATRQDEVDTPDQGTNVDRSNWMPLRSKSIDRICALLMATDR